MEDQARSFKWRLKMVQCMVGYPKEQGQLIAAIWGKLKCEEEAA